MRAYIMHTKKGTGRIVILDFFGFAIKFPRILTLVTAFKFSLYLYKRKGFEKSKKGCAFLFRNHTRHFLSCIRQNLNEYLLWKKLKAPFLSKTYFSFGIMNIQNFEKGDHPTKEELSAIFKRIDASTHNERMQLSSHCLNLQNFIRTKKGLRLVDYGDTTERPGLPLDAFLIKWKDVLQKEFRDD